MRYGIEVGGGDLVMRNTAGGNAGTPGPNATADYSPSNGGNVGPIGVPMTSTSPWANF
jgi:hypothetical protein